MHMGQLKYIADLDLDLDWYFEDAYRLYDKWNIEFPNKQYLYSQAIHFDTFRDTVGLKIWIREWIENSIDDLVFMTIDDKTYFRYYNEERRWDGRYQVSNRWRLFHFSSEESSLMFKLRFGEYIKEVTTIHPKYIDDNC